MLLSKISNSRRRQRKTKARPRAKSRMRGKRTARTITKLSTQYITAIPSWWAFLAYPFHHGVFFFAPSAACCAGSGGNIQVPSDKRSCTRVCDVISCHIMSCHQKKRPTPTHARIKVQETQHRRSRGGWGGGMEQAEDEKVSYELAVSHHEPSTLL